MDTYDNLPNKISIEELEGFGDNILGVKVIVVCHNKAYCGVIKHILKDVRRIWLIKCFTYEGNMPLLGVVTVCYNDISFISILKIDEDIKRQILKRTAEETKRSRKLIMQRLANPKQQLQGEDEEENDCEQTVRVLNTSFPEAPYSDSIYKVSVQEIYTADENYTAAMEDINSENVVGLVVKGKALGRKGALGWISVATPTTVYHFDVVRLDFQKMLDTGFRLLLEHPYRVKVLHDSRSFQDFLLHRHACQMEKVFDIQITDWYMQMRKGDGKEFCLAKTFKEILKISHGFEESHFPASFSNPVSDSAWMERSLPEELMLECEFAAMHLIAVRRIMIDNALSDLQHQTDAFVHSISKMDQYSAEIAEHMIIPQEVQQMWQKKTTNRVVYREHPAAKLKAPLK